MRMARTGSSPGHRQSAVGGSGAQSVGSLALAADAAMKRSIAEVAPPEEEEEDGPPLWEREPSKYISAKAALKLHFGDGAASFAPEFVHQIFDGEAVAYAGEPPLEVSLGRRDVDPVG